VSTGINVLEFRTRHPIFGAQGPWKPSLVMDDEQLASKEWGEDLSNEYQQWRVRRYVPEHVAQQLIADLERALAEARARAEGT
jgi:hypothetical protein